MILGDCFFEDASVAQMSDGGFEAHLQAFAADFFEVAVEGLAFGNLKVGEGIVDLVQL